MSRRRRRPVRQQRCGPSSAPLSRFRLWGGRGWVDEPEKEGEEAASAINVRRRAARRRGTLRRARVCERAGWGGVEGDEGGDGGVLGPWAHRSLAAAHLRSTVEPPLTPRVHARRLHRRRGRRRRRNDDGQLKNKPTKNEEEEKKKLAQQRARIGPARLGSGAWAPAWRRYKRKRKKSKEKKGEVLGKPGEIGRKKKRRRVVRDSGALAAWRAARDPVGPAP